MARDGTARGWGRGMLRHNRGVGARQAGRTGLVCIVPSVRPPDFPAPTGRPPSVQIIDLVFDDWEERYRYIIGAGPI